MNYIKTTILSGILSIILMSSPVQAGAFGCLVGAAGGGFGGAQIGKGAGRLAATAFGTLLGCSVGSGLQDRDAARYQQRQPRYPYQQGGYVDYRYSSPGSQYQEYARRRAYYPPPVQRVIIQQVAPPTQRQCPYTREYQSTVMVGGRQVPAYGQACSWDGGQNWSLGPLAPAQ